MAKTKKQRLEIGTIRVLEGTSKDGKNYKISKLQFNSNVKLLVGKYNKVTKKVEDFQEVDLSEYYGAAEINDAEQSLDTLLRLGFMDEEEHKRKLQTIREKGIVKNVTLVKNA